MPKKIIFVKVNVNEAFKNGIVNVAVPMAGEDIEVFNKLSSPFRANITKSRNILHHRKFFAICKMMIDNAILDKIEIKPIVLEHLKLRFKNDCYVLVYILKWLFIPLEKKIMPDGRVFEDVSSISFDEMDQESFQSFYSKCVEYFCDVLDVTEEKIMRNLK
jgi:hypothetical protein